MLCAEPRSVGICCIKNHPKRTLVTTNYFSWFYEQLNSSGLGYPQLAAQLGLVGPGWPLLHMSDNLALGWDNGDNWATCLSLACSHRGGYRSPKNSERGQAPIYKHLLSVWFCHICYCLSGWSKWHGSTQSQSRRDSLRVWIQEENYDHFANNLLQSLRRMLQRTEIQLLLVIKGVAWLMKLKTPKYGWIQVLKDFTKDLYFTVSLSFNSTFISDGFLLRFFH